MKKLKCKRYKGKIISKDRWILDQLSDKPNQWFFGGGNRYQETSVFLKHVKETYGLTAQQYYNIIVYDDINYVGKCKTCGKETEFIKLSKGYRDYCCHWCTSASDETRENRFLAYGYTKAKFYIVETDNPKIMKLGVTGTFGNGKYSKFNIKLKNYQFLKEGKPKKIIKLETECRHRFCNGWTELFDRTKLEQVLEYVQNY